MIATSEHINIIKLILTDPNTGQTCEVSSPIKSNNDGTMSFTIRNPQTGQEWMHTLITEEV